MTAFTYCALYRREDRTDPPLGLLAEGSVTPERPLVVIGEAPSLILKRPTQQP